MGDDFKIMEINEESKRKAKCKHSETGQTINIQTLKFEIRKCNVNQKKKIQCNGEEFCFEKYFRDIQLKLREVIIQSEPPFKCTLFGR